MQIGIADQDRPLNSCTLANYLVEVRDLLPQHFKRLCLYGGGFFVWAYQYGGKVFFATNLNSAKECSLYHFHPAQHSLLTSFLQFIFNVFYA